MPIVKHIPWHDPLEYAAGIPESESHWALYHSSQSTHYSGNHSFIALKPAQRIESDNFLALDQALSSDQNTYANAWFGYLGYNLRHDLEPQLPKDPEGMFNLPALSMFQPSLLLAFDHQQHTATAYATSTEALNVIPSPTVPTAPSYTEVSALTSNMSKSDYLAHVNTIKQHITQGVCSQANLTRKFNGTFTSTTNGLALFKELCTISPSPYSAYLKLGDTHIISSSPEKFLSIDADGNATARPIKGSASRSDDPYEDQQHKVQLGLSEKDRSENLMIVDLTRNDLTRACEIGSINVPELFEITSHPTIHHMSSTIIGKRAANHSTLDLIKACFPPGSMTGSPKIKAMELCSQLEQMERGVYAGAIGWFGGDGSADLSVVIRTIITDGTQFEFQVGGAIVYDSDAEKEWQETLFKATAITKALGLKESDLAAI